MKRLLQSKPVVQALRGAALVVTDRRWTAPLSAAALGFGIFAGVAIGPGASGGLATGARQIVQLPGPGDEEGQSGGGGQVVAPTDSASLFEGAGEEGGFEEEVFGASGSLAPVPVEPMSAPAPESTPVSKPEPAPTAAGEEGEGEGQRFEGTVAAANRAAGSYALALDSGELVAVHAAKLPEPGTKLSGPLRSLANTTYAEAGGLKAEKRKARAVTLEGTVTWARPDVSPAYTVSGRGVSLLVGVPPDPAGVPVELPAIGSLVQVEARIEPPAEPRSAPALVQSDLEVDRALEPSTYLELAGIVEEVTPDGSRLAFSAEWSGESASTLDLSVPEGIAVERLKTGDSYLATAELAPDGALTLKGIVGDERVKGADDARLAQGDLRR